MINIQQSASQTASERYDESYGEEDPPAEIDSASSTERQLKQHQSQFAADKPQYEYQQALT